MTFTWLFGLLTCVYVRSGSGVPISLGVKVGSGDWRDTADGSPYPRLGGVAIAVYLASTIGVAPAAVEVTTAILAESDWAIVDGTGGDAELEHQRAVPAAAVPGLDGRRRSREVPGRELLAATPAIARSCPASANTSKRFRALILGKECDGIVKLKP